jgi:G3E family GTPase
MSKIPILLITGFLGSGKTTFLSRFIKANEHRRTLYLINEFSKNDVDGVTLKNNAIDLKTIPGGSIFCNCLITEFVETLKSVIDSETKLEDVVIETSGITNPFNAEKMLVESGLNDSFYIKQIVSVADATNYLELNIHLKNIKNQINASDIVILNKTDKVTKDRIKRTKKRISSINETAEIVLTKFCNFDLSILSTNENNKISAEEIMYSEKYSRFSLRTKKNLNFEVLEKLVKDESACIFRVKGFANINNVLHSINYSGSGWDVIKVPTGHTPSLEFVFSNIEGKRIISKLKCTELFNSK